MKTSGQNAKKWALIAWLTIIIGALYLYFFQGGLIRAEILKIAGLPLLWLCIIYLVLGCLRGFTLIPVTYLIFLGLVFLPALPAYILTIIGVMVSSACIYYFSLAPSQNRF